MNTDETPELDGTEAQRKALEEMSDQLLQRLNSMVAEQEARAAEFAARTHSLSALPELTQPQETPGIPTTGSRPTVSPLPQQPAPQTFAQPSHTEPAQPAIKIPPLVRKKAEPEPAPEPPRPIRRPAPQQKKTEESSIGAGTLIIIVCIIYALIKSCS